MSGALSMTLGNDDKPVDSRHSDRRSVERAAGLSAVLMALLRRETTGRGDYIEIAMHDAMLAACANIVGPVMAEGRQPVAKHERSTGGAAFYQIYANARRPPHRARRAGGEVRAQSARTRSGAPTSLRSACAAPARISSR